MASLKSTAQPKSLGTQEGLLLCSCETGFSQYWESSVFVFKEFKLLDKAQEQLARAISKSNFLSLESTYHKCNSHLPKYFTVTLKICLTI